MGELQPVKTLDRSPFKCLVCTIGNLPTSFVDSMSYYEALAWLVQYIEKTLIPAVNDDTEAIQELQIKFVELKEYVEDYFSDLNVQEQIDNKLDEMALSGQLADIINQEIFGDINEHLGTLDGEITAIERDIDNLETAVNSKINPFDTVEDMVESEIATAGTYARTLGFYEVNDNGGGLYKITEKQESDTPNGMDIIAIGDDLIATLIVNKQAVNPAQLGAKLDGITDDTDVVYHALELGNVLFPSSSTVFLDELEMIPYRILDFNTSTVICNGTAIKMGSNPRNQYFRDAHIKNVLFSNSATSASANAIKTLYMGNCIRCSLDGITQSHVEQGQVAIYIENCFNIDIDEVYLGNGNSSLTAGSSGIIAVASSPAGGVLGTNNLTNNAVRNALIQNVSAGIDLKISDGSIDTFVMDNIGLSNCDNGFILEGTSNSTKNIMLSNSRVEGTNIAVYNFGQLTIENLNINFLTKNSAIGIYNRSTASLVCKGCINFINSSTSLINQGFADFSGCHVFGSASQTPANTEVPIIRPMVLATSAHSGTDFGNFIHPINDYTIMQNDAYTIADLPTTGVNNGTSFVIMYNGEQIKYTYRSQTWYASK